MGLVIPSRVYRAVQGDALRSSDFESNAARGRPVPKIDEPIYQADHFGISTFESLAYVRSRLRWARFAAEIDLPPDYPAAKTFGAGHWTVWGRPEVLMALARLVPVD